MSDLALTIAGHRYDHTRALLDGTVRIDGVRPTFETAELVSDVFEAMVRHHAYDVAELGLTFYLRTLDLPDPPFVALPVFLARNFRHSAIFVNTASGIERPEDLAGRTVGEFGIYGHDAGIWPKGILADDFGVTPDQCRWIVGGGDRPIPPFDFVPQPHPATVDVRRAPEGSALGPMLEAGEIDAFISARPPRAFVEGSPAIRRLFVDYEEVERAYHRRTGIFPIMHTVVVRRELLDRHPHLAASLFDAFTQAKDLSVRQLRDATVEQHMEFTTPWVTSLVERNHALLGDDPWPYGVAANRVAVDTFLRYFFEQGLGPRRLTCEDVFVPELLGT